MILKTTPDEWLRDMLRGVEADVVVCGHTHMQFDRMVGRLRVVNAGSVGMPFGTTGADWLLLGPGIEQLRYTTERYWKELRVAVPSSAGGARLDRRRERHQREPAQRDEPAEQRGRR